MSCCDYERAPKRRRRPWPGSESVVRASRDSNADDEHDPEGATIGFERAQLTALLRTARERIVEVDDALLHGLRIERAGANAVGLLHTVGGH